MAGPLDVEVVALHVHHGLNIRAEAWLAHCKAQCEAWARDGHSIVFSSRRIHEAPALGDSVEAWARRQRYAALREMAVEHHASLVLLAHHRCDQAETFFLQALRGGGMAGLAGMPRQAEREGITWARPWLDQPRERIEAYLCEQRLDHVDDDSNEDERYSRSRLRKHLWPALIGAFAHSEIALTEAAAWAQEAAACLAELAAQDLAIISADSSLDLDAWMKLSWPRRSNALRSWFKRGTGRSADAALVKRLMAELPGCRSARWPMADGELRSYRGTLTYRAGPIDSDAQSATRESTLRVVGAGIYDLPGWGGVLRASRVEDGGVAVALLKFVVLRDRSGSEQFQAGPGRPARSLKKQFQSAGVPPTERGGPLIYSDEKLLFVPGLGIDARTIAPRGVPQLQLDWIAGAPSGKGTARKEPRRTDS